MKTLAIVLLLVMMSPAWASVDVAAIQTSLALPAAKVKEPITDDSIRDQVMVRLASDQVVKGGNIDVDVKDGVVTLKGAVPSDEARHKAEKLAKRVKGVKSVVNQLTIKE
jgi:osmotically-inducible protein OsmY